MLVGKIVSSHWLDYEQKSNIVFDMGAICKLYSVAGSSRSTRDIAFGSKAINAPVGQP